jgi:hypothetical protein
VIGLDYFIGFTGVWLVLALYLQDGLGYSPLRSRLSVTPFAIGVAPSAVIAGRLVPRHRGPIGAAVRTLADSVRAYRDGGRAAHDSHAGTTYRRRVGAMGHKRAAGCGRSGRGMVTSPNVTLTLEKVPVRMAGAAGGALQTGQRIGAATGTATLATIFYHVLNQTGHDYQAAVSDALLSTCAFMLLALLIALGEVIWRRLHVGVGLAARPGE